MSSKANSSAKSSPQIPTKWAVAIVAVLICYTLAQPFLNRRFGWNLPPLAGAQATKDAPNVTIKTSIPADANSTAKSTSKSSPESAKPTESTSSSTATQAAAAQSISQLRYGILRETAPEDYLSPGGLRYTRGGPEGHRLTHIQRHLEDDPERPGSHGVFDGDMAQVVRWLDEAYALAARGAKGTSKSDEGDGRTKYEASFSKPIGYVGGRDGKRANNPDARRVRIILEGNKVITAFPIK